MNILLIDDCEVTRLGLQTISKTEGYNYFNFYNTAYLPNHILCQKLKRGVLIISLVSISFKKTQSLIEKIRMHMTPHFKTILICDDLNKTIYEDCWLKSNVQGFISLNSYKNDINKCLDQISNNKTFISESLSNKAKMEKLSLDYNSSDLNERLQYLTGKEMKVLEHVIAGRTSSEIAETLFNSKRTIETHRRNITGKLELKGQGRLALFAMQHKNELLDIIGTYKQKHVV